MPTPAEKYLEVGDLDDGPREPMEIDGLSDALHTWILKQDYDWLVDAVCEACANGDLLFLQRQVERHIDGWVRP